MESNEPIIRLVKYLLQEVLPVNLALAGPPQDDDAPNLYLPPPSPTNVVTTFQNLAKDRWPQVVILFDDTVPVDADTLQNCSVDASQRHTFSVWFCLADSEKNAEDLTFKVSRYAQVIKDTIRGFTEADRVAAFEASQPGLESVDFFFEVGATSYNETAKSATMLIRECVIEFACYS